MVKSLSFKDKIIFSDIFWFGLSLFVSISFLAWRIGWGANEAKKGLLGKK